jgi:hypothetical protein
MWMGKVTSVKFISRRICVFATHYHSTRAPYLYCFYLPKTQHNRGNCEDTAAMILCYNIAFVKT